MIRYVRRGRFLDEDIPRVANEWLTSEGGAGAVLFGANKIDAERLNLSTIMSSANFIWAGRRPDTTVFWKGGPMVCIWPSMDRILKYEDEISRATDVLVFEWADNELDAWFIQKKAIPIRVSDISF